MGYFDHIRVNWAAILLPAGTLPRLAVCNFSRALFKKQLSNSAQEYALYCGVSNGSLDWRIIHLRGSQAGGGTWRVQLKYHYPRHSQTRSNQRRQATWR